MVSMKQIKNSYAIIIIIAYAISLVACSSSAVVSSSNGPTISQARAEAYDGPKKRITVKAFTFRAST